MVPKGERFEMRMDEATLERIDRWRSEEPDRPSRAEAIRRLVETGLATRHSDSVTFSDGEKLLLLMMGDLYKHLRLTSQEAVDVDFISKVIYGGHYWAPKWELTGVFHGHADDQRHLRKVLDVLEMWDFLERGYERLSTKDRARVAKEAAPFGKPVEFVGFDGNNEAEYLGIAYFLVNEMKRYTRFAKRDLNSHMPTLAMHERMLGVFQPMKQGIVRAELDATLLIKVLKAMPYPKR